MAQKLEWFSTLRARLGVTPTPDSLLYATGGLAVGGIRASGTITGSSLNVLQGTTVDVIQQGTIADVDENGNPIEIPIQVPVDIPFVTASTNPATPSFASPTPKAGVAVGAGAEVRLAGNWTGKVEYLYLDFGRVSTLATNSLNSTPLAVSFDSRVTNQIARVGLNYKFDPTGAGYAASAGLPPMLFKAPVLASWTWAGPYLGVNAGYGWGNASTGTLISDASIGVPLVASSTSTKLAGMTFGGQTGFNWQAGPWVAGIQGDLQRSNQSARTTTFNCAGAICNPAISAVGLDAPVSATMAQKLEWFGTLRGRFGATPTPDSLVYATGGLAVGRIKTSGTITGSSLTLTPSLVDGVFDTTVPGVDDAGNPVDIPVEIPVQTPTLTARTRPLSSSFASSPTKAGFAVGGVAEVHLGGNWTGKVEYLYLDFGRVSTLASNPLNSTPLAINFDSRVTNQIVRVELNYKFDPAGRA